MLLKCPGKKDIFKELRMRFVIFPKTIISEYLFSEEIILCQRVAEKRTRHWPFAIFGGVFIKATTCGACPTFACYRCGGVVHNFVHAELRHCTGYISGADSKSFSLRLMLAFGPRGWGCETCAGCRNRLAFLRQCSRRLS